MKHPFTRIAAILVLSSGLLARGNTLYVNQSSANPTTPYSDWSTAATNIQDAIDASTDGDQIWVTNGVYQTGGKAMVGDLTNRVVLDKAVTVQSVNGPFVTTIAGLGATNSAIAVRCAWLTNNAALIGFTLTRGATRGSSPDQISFGSGGAAWCASSNAVVTGCVIVSNTAYYRGGAAYQGTLNTCFISSNSVPVSLSGGAVYAGILNNCTVVSNYCTGFVNCRATNCISYYNPGNYSGGSFAYSCTTPDALGTGNFHNAPQFFADHIHLAPGSPGIGAGTTTITSLDIFGKAWGNPASVGCAETGALPLVTTPQIQLLSTPVGFMMTNVFASGTLPLSFHWLKDGALLQEDGHFAFAQSTNLTANGVKFDDAGNYQLVVSNSFGATTSAVAQVIIHFANVAGLNPIAPYTTWQTAATNIQDAITAAVANEFILVTNGVYATGGKSMDNLITNRISVDKVLLVQSVNGPDATMIQGVWDPAGTNGPAAVRCVWMTNNSILSGFTVCGGATRPISLNPNQSMSGGGIWASSSNAVVDGCLILTNCASYVGGGAYAVTLNYCTIATNYAADSYPIGGGVGNSGSGGGAANSRLKNCIVASNFAEQMSGGGTINCTSTNCAYVNNHAPLLGSGAYEGTLVNCTLVNNTSGGYGSFGGAAASATLINCIVYGNFNIGPGSTNYTSCTFSYSDSDPLPAGTGNIDVDPQLLPDNFHLMTASPCIGAGSSISVSGIDIDNQAWNGPPSIGCDEWNPSPVMVTQLAFSIGTPSRRSLIFNAIGAGQSPFNNYWYKDGELIQETAHYVNSSSSNLIVNGFQPEDSGSYQLVLSNAFGMATSHVSQVTIHAVDISNANPVPPYSTWQTAATNIQDAIDAAADGDIILVTNGIFATGGKVKSGDLTNRVALDRALTVISINGYADTVIEGAWDPVSTNGPAAVRCAWLATGATLNGFTLRNGATRSNINDSSLCYGGGVFMVNEATISDCVITNNQARYSGGGVAGGLVDNSFINNNSAQIGGGAYLSWLYNCTVTRNHCFLSIANGAGTYASVVQNSIVINNYLSQAGNPDASLANDFSSSSRYSYTCTSPLRSGTGNINVNPQFIDGGFRIAAASPCRGVGSALYASGIDLDGELFATPPSMGCDEVVEANLTGPISASVQQGLTGNLVNHHIEFFASPYGRIAATSWLVSDGSTATNALSLDHVFTNVGVYTLTFTVYNTDHPSGVSSNLTVTIDPLNWPLLQSAGVVSNSFQFSFDTQYSANYTVQYSTNLPPVNWRTLQTFSFSTGGVLTVRDPAITNGSCFYRVQPQ